MEVYKQWADLSTKFEIQDHPADQYSTLGAVLGLKSGSIPSMQPSRPVTLGV